MRRGGTNLLVVSKMRIATQWGGQHLLVTSKMGANDTTRRYKPPCHVVCCHHWQYSHLQLQVVLPSSSSSSAPAPAGSVAVAVIFSTCSFRWCRRPRPRHFRHLQPQVVLPSSSSSSSAPAADGGVVLILVVLSTCSCRWCCRPPAGRPHRPQHHVVLPSLPFIVAVGTGSVKWVVNGGEREVEAMSWHIIDVMGHGTGNPVT